MISGNWLLPDKTVYDTERGSYFDSYNSFKHIRAPVVLMYCKVKTKMTCECVHFLNSPILNSHS